MYKYNLWDGHLVWGAAQNTQQLIHPIVYNIHQCLHKVRYAVR